MTHSLRLSMLVALLVVAALAFPLHAQLSQEELKGIQEAAPMAASVKPKQPRLLLIFNLSEGYKHSAIPRASQALEIIGKKTGAYETIQSEDLSVFLPGNLKRFDAVCFNNTTQLKFEDPVLRKGLLDFIASGKGIIGIHAATDNFPTWPEGQELFGGVFDGHPWTADGTWEVKIDDPGHPLTSAFKGKGFAIRDEIYRVRQLNLRMNSRVLLGLDMKAERNRKAAGVRPSDRDIPISWVRAYGKGRFFYCSLGHNAEVYANSAVLKHYLDGIQFALGDLQAESTPVPFDPMTFFDQDMLTDLLRRVAAYTYGESRAPLSGLDEFIRSMDDLPEARLKIETQFLEFLKGPATPAGKQCICMRLARVGSEASVPQLKSMLTDTLTAEMALYALEPIEGSAVDAALEQALPGARGKTLVGVINVLGNRRFESATTVLEPFVVHPDARVALAAVSALGKIGTLPAMNVLEGAKGNVKGEVRTGLFDAVLVCADQLGRRGEKGRSMSVYKGLVSSDEPVPVRRAALRGAILSDSANSAAMILGTLRSRDVALHPVAAQLVSRIPDMDGIRAIARALPEFPPPTQVQVLASLGAYRNHDVQKAVLAAAVGKIPDVRIAALRTVGAMGNAGAVSMLALAATSSKGVEQKEARASLYALRGPGVDDSILVLLPRASGLAKVELLKATAERRIVSATPLVLQTAKDPSGPVRVESAKTLKSIAGAEDLPAIAGLLIQARDEASRRELELAAVATARRMPDRTRQDEAILAAYSGVKSKSARTSLISVLGKIGAPGSLPTLRAALKDPDQEIRLAGIRALSEWPTSEPYSDLRSIAQSAKEPAHRILALRGSVRLIGLDSNSTADETVRRYREAMAIAPNSAERKSLLSAVGEARSVAALRMAASYLDDKDLKPEAEAATLNIAEGISDGARGETVPQLQRVIASSRTPVHIERASALIKKIERFDDYITSWDFSGPYEKPGVRLIDEPFPPEQSVASGVSWAPFRGSTNPGKLWLLELDRAFGAGDRVVYLRTNIWSPADQKAGLEFGSDFRARLWMNEKPIHSCEQIRSVAPGEDRVPTALLKGWNVLLMKLEQGDGPWGACIRVRTPEGGKLEGIRVSTSQN
jgi:type 1 glutamine amidotransferase/HEAT repeat protein